MAPRAAAGTSVAERERWSRWSPLLPILVLAALLRLWGLADQPALYFDSGVYLGEGQFLASVVERSIQAFSGGIADATAGPRERVVRSLERGTEAHPPDIAKPGHALLLAVSMLVFGKTFFAGALVSALSGVGAVAATYAVGVLGWGRRVAVFGALLLAVSGQHLAYSREALVESDGLFFATLAVLVYLRAGLRPPNGGVRSLLAAGLLFGIAFSCNNRLSFWPAMLAPVELLRWREAGWRRWPVPIGRGAALVAGFLAPIVLIEGVYLLARLVGRSFGAATDWMDYLQQLAAFSRMNAPDRIRWDEWPTFWVDLSLMDGLLVVGLLLVGIAVAARRGTRADLLLLASLVVPVALFSVYSTGEVRMRHFSLALPWVALAAGIGVDAISAASRRVSRRAGSAAGAALLAIALILAAPRTLDLASAPNGYPALLDFLQTNGTPPTASTNGPVLGFLVGEGRTNARLRAAFVNTESDLRSLAESYGFLAVEMQAYVFPGDLTARYDSAQTVFDAANGNATWYLADLLDHHGMTWGRWTEILALWERNRDAASRLRLYPLRALEAPG